MFKASFSTFAFDRHTHDEYAIGVIEQGVQHFSHKGTSYVAPPSTIITVNPDELHDGRAYTEGGYRYRMLYLALPELQRYLDGYEDRGGLMAFRKPVTVDPEIAWRLHWALKLIESDPPLVDEVLPPVIIDLFSRHASPKPQVSSGRGNPGAVARAVDLINSCPHENISLDRISAAAGLSKFHFLRVFKETTGVTPHAYQLRRRVELGKRALEEGKTPSLAAIAAGFSDQSHMTRRFKAVYGVTPGEFLRTCCSG